MDKLTKTKIRKMVMQELASMVGEDAIINPANTHDEYRSNSHARTPHNLSLTKQSDSYDDFGGAQDVCEQCGGMALEGDCMECGYSGGQMLQESGCGCGGSSSDDDGSDYSTDTMNMIGDALGALTHPGYDDDTTKGAHRSHNNYMAKPSLYKVAKYAQKLLQMIPDGYELDDWQRTKIAQLADDISEVYHSLDYDFHDED
tara:strand:- start:93 stop:695 length:603 start_codon:yes stop_codon:yes gene_type:complete